MDSHVFQQDNPAAALEAAVEAEEAGQWKQAYALAAPLSRNLQISQPMRLRAGEVALRAAVAGLQWTDADMVLRVILAQNDPGALRRARAVIVDAPMGADREALIGRLDQAQGSAALRGSELGASLLGDLDVPAPAAPAPPPVVRQESAPEPAAELSPDDDDEDFKFEGEDDTEEEAAAWLERARLAETEQAEAGRQEASLSSSAAEVEEEDGDHDVGDLSLGMLPRSSLIDDDLEAAIRAEGGRFVGDPHRDGAGDTGDAAADPTVGSAPGPVTPEPQPTVPATPEYNYDSPSEAEFWDGDADPWSDAAVEPEPVRDWTDADIDALEEEFGEEPEVNPLRAGPPPLETPWMAAAMHEPTPDEQDDESAPLPFLDFTEVKPEDVHRIVVSNPGESGREILRRFAEAQAQRTTPGQLLTNYNMGLAFHQMETTDAYEQAVTFLIPPATIDNPDRLGAVEVLARTLFHLDRLEEAHGYLTAAVGANPRDPEYGPIFYWLGKIAEERGRPNEALPYYAHAVALEPSLVEAKRRIRAIMG